MAYLESRAEREALLDLPLDLRLNGVAEDRIIARLQAERDQASVLTPKHDTAMLTSVLFVERTPDLALARSIQSLALQSNPSLRCILAVSPHIDLGFLEQFLAELEFAPQDLAVLSTDAGALNAALGATRYVCFLRHGDRLHPSTVAWLAITHASAAPDVFTWDEYQPGAAGWVQSNPSLHLISLLHFPYLRNAFAVSSRLAQEYSGDLFSEAQGNDLHLFQLWLAGHPDTQWRAHPEGFLIRGEKRIGEAPVAAARRAFAGRENAYTKALSAFDDLALAPNDENALAPYRLLPQRRARSISVIIPFRNRPELTLRAIRSVGAQSAAERAEIILVNNQSSPETIDQLRAELAAMSCPSWRLVDYPLPFNHSAQCNLGVRESSGEVVVFLNNDAELISRDTLEEMAAWALYPKIASVGSALTDAGAVAAGMEARRNSVARDSMVEEYSDQALTPFVRDVFGNSFAAAALSRGVFDEIGALDAVRFPNGFNDVEFACRARARGFRHIVLGHCLVEHTRGASRTRADETAAKLLLRTLYPEAASAALNDLQMQPALPSKSVAAHVRNAPKAPLPKKPPSAPAPRGPLIIRVASRISATPLAQQILSNPHAFRIIRGAWRLVRRSPT